MGRFGVHNNSRLDCPADKGSYSVYDKAEQDIILSTLMNNSERKYYRSGVPLSGTLRVALY